MSENNNWNGASHICPVDFKSNALPSQLPSHDITTNSRDGLFRCVRAQRSSGRHTIIQIKPHFKLFVLKKPAFHPSRRISNSEQTSLERIVKYVYKLVCVKVEYKIQATHDDNKLVQYAIINQKMHHTSNKPPAPP